MDRRQVRGGEIELCLDRIDLRLNRALRQVGGGLVQTFIVRSAVCGTSGSLDVQKASVFGKILIHHQGREFVQ